jgi:hypothetical protein
MPATNVRSASTALSWSCAGLISLAAARRAGGAPIAGRALEHAAGVAGEPRADLPVGVADVEVELVDLVVVRARAAPHDDHGVDRDPAEHVELIERER